MLFASGPSTSRLQLHLATALVVIIVVYIIFVKHNSSEQDIHDEYLRKNKCFIVYHQFTLSGTLSAKNILISQSPAVEEVISKLTDTEYVEYVGLEYCENLSTKSLSQLLSKCPRLKIVEIKYCSNVDVPRVLKGIINKKYVIVTLMGENVDDKAALMISSMGNMEQLYLIDTTISKEAADAVMNNSSIHGVTITSKRLPERIYR
jgi:hypothetical protein